MSTSDSPGAVAPAPRVHKGLRRRWPIPAIAVIITLALIVFSYAAWRFEPGRASAWFQAEAVVLASIATVAASLAAWFTYPAYQEWTRQQQTPNIKVIIEVGDLEQPLSVSTAGTCVLRDIRSFQLRVAINNIGEATLDNAALNICVPSRYWLHAIDDPRVPHYDLAGTAQNGHIKPLHNTRVRATAAFGHFPPGIRMFHAELRVDNGMTLTFNQALSQSEDTALPIVVELTARNMLPSVHRIEIVFEDLPSGASMEVDNASS